MTPLSATAHLPPPLPAFPVPHFSGPVGRRLHHFWHNWLTIGADEWVVLVLRDGYYHQWWHTTADVRSTTSVLPRISPAVPGAGPTDRVPPPEAGHRGGPQANTRILQQTLPGIEEDRRLASCHRFEPPQQLSYLTTLPYGNSSLHPQIHGRRSLDIVPRPEGHLLPHPSSSGTQEVPALPVWPSSFPLSSTTVWSDHFALPLDPPGQAGRSLCQVQGTIHHPVPRRLASFSSIPTELQQVDPVAASTRHQLGSSGQPTEVRPDPQADLRLHRHHLRPLQWSSMPSSSQGADFPQPAQILRPVSSSPGCSLAAGTGTHDVAREADSSRPSAHAPSTVRSPRYLEPTAQPTSPTNPHHTRSPVSPRVVVSSAQPDFWSSSASTSSAVTAVHWCINRGVGSPLGPPAGGGAVDPRTATPTHQHTGAPGSPPGTPALSAASGQPFCDHHDRQLHSGCPDPQPGRDSLETTPPPNCTTAIVGQQSQHPPAPQTHSVSSKCSGSPMAVLWPCWMWIPCIFPSDWTHLL